MADNGRTGRISSLRAMYTMWRDLHVPWARMIVGLGMIAEGLTLAINPTQVQILIGTGWIWTHAFILGGLCVFAAAFMNPGNQRALVAAIPILTQLYRAYATWAWGHQYIFSGGVTVRVSLASMMIAALGWSSDASYRVRKQVRDLA